MNKIKFSSYSKYVYKTVKKLLNDSYPDDIPDASEMIFNNDMDTSNMIRTNKFLNKLNQKLRESGSSLSIHVPVKKEILNREAIKLRTGLEMYLKEEYDEDSRYSMFFIKENGDVKYAAILDSKIHSFVAILGKYAVLPRADDLDQINKVIPVKLELNYFDIN